MDLAGQQAGSPFPGSSLARFWQSPTPTAMVQHASASPSLSEVVPDPRNHDGAGTPGRRVPQAALKDSDWSYIRREGDLREMLFQLRDDPNERNDLSADPSAQTDAQSNAPGAGASHDRPTGAGAIRPLTPLASVRSARRILA